MAQTRHINGKCVLAARKDSLNACTQSGKFLTINLMYDLILYVEITFIIIISANKICIYIKKEFGCDAIQFLLELKKKGEKHKQNYLTRSSWKNKIANKKYMYKKVDFSKQERSLSLRTFDNSPTVSEV